MQTQGEAGADRIVRERFFADATHGVFDSHGEAYETGAVSYESFSSLAVKPAYRELRADADVKTIKVDVRRLDTILAEHAPGVERLRAVARRTPACGAAAPRLPAATEARLDPHLRSRESRRSLRIRPSVWQWGQYVMT